jgi:hypothetical protein
MDSTESAGQDPTDTQANDVTAPASLLTSQPAETKPAGAPADAANPGADKPADPTDADKAKEEKPQGAPEKYEFTAPEGVTLDAAAVAAFEPIAKELNLTNDQAQKLVELQSSLVQQQREAWTGQLENWSKEVKADKEIGGEAFTGSIKAAQQALTQFGTPELRAALDSTSMGNHPELVRVFAKIGKAMAEDTFVSATRQANSSKSAADIMFGN